MYHEPQHGVLAEALAGVKRALMGQPVEVRRMPLDHPTALVVVRLHPRR